MEIFTFFINFGANIRLEPEYDVHHWHAHIEWPLRDLGLYWDETDSLKQSCEDTPWQLIWYPTRAERTF